MAPMIIPLPWWGRTKGGGRPDWRIGGYDNYVRGVEAGINPGLLVIPHGLELL
jgi:hypothetical protein